jgi:hypothetical protein
MGVKWGRFSPSAPEFFSAPQGINPPVRRGVNCTGDCIIVQRKRPGLLLFAKAFLAVVKFVCVLASYCQLAKIQFPPLFFSFLCLVIWMVCSNFFFKCFESCSRPTTAHHHHIPHYSSIIMVLTRRSIISPPNWVYTRSCSSLFLFFFIEWK